MAPKTQKSGYLSTKYPLYKDSKKLSILFGFNPLDYVFICWGSAWIYNFY